MLEPIQPLLPLPSLSASSPCPHAQRDDGCYTEEMQETVGLPEERKLVMHALQSGMAVVVVDAHDRKLRRWNLARDGERIARALEACSVRNEWPSTAPIGGTMALPLYCTGIGDGAEFVLQLTKCAPLSSIARARARDLSVTHLYPLNSPPRAHIVTPPPRDPLPPPPPPRALALS